MVAFIKRIICAGALVRAKANLSVAVIILKIVGSAGICLVILSSCLLFFFSFTGCVSRNTKSGDTLFVQLDSAQTHVAFVNHLSDTGELNILDYLYYYNGGGVAAGDVNNDGFTDLYFVSNLNRNKLYINEGGRGKLFSFKDISFQAGVQGTADWQTGVTMADVNGDGWLDIYVCSVSEFRGLKGSNELYINNGLNENGEVTFTESAQEYGLAFSGFSTQAVFFDYDKDTDLDMYLLNHAVHTSRSYDYAAKRIVKDAQAGDYLFENQRVSVSVHENGSILFRDVTQEAGIYQASMGYGLGISVADFNHDGWDDIYVGNDFHEDDYYYLNNGDGTFTERLKDYFGHVSRFSMGCDAADINNDGYPDLMSLDMYPEDETIQKSSAGEDPFDIFRFKLTYGYYYQYSRNCLQVNIGGKAFSERGVMAGVAATDWSWSTLIADYDNDGLKDIFITNGIVRRPNDLDYIKFISSNAQRWTSQNARALDGKAIELMPEGQVHNYLFRGTKSLHFDDISESSGFSLPSISNGASYADLDNDGDLDLITNNINEPAGIHQNKSDVFYKNAFLKIKLNGHRPNTSGIGSKIFLKCNGALQFQQLMPTRGFLSSSEPLLLFGLGEATSVDTLMVIWPDQKTQIITDVSVNRTVELDQGDADDNGKGQGSMLFHKSTPVLEDVTDRYALDYVHEENTYYDFDSQALIPFQVSSEGPKLAKADVNNDGLDDFYVGRARNQAGILYVQGPGDRFSPAPIAAFSGDSIFEDVDAVFFDADNDKDMDLYVVSGGNDLRHGNPQLADRLYMNDGKGNFQRHTNNLPATYSNKSCVRPRDFDNDGDMDLFVGGRVISGSYGDAADSYLLINDGKGKFSDHTQRLAPGLKNAGMVTDAQWFDWDTDGDDDLIMAGDWMPIRIFRNESNRLAEVKEIKGLERSNGFWQVLHAGDFDQDGDIDFVAGNLGTNTTLQESAGSSVRLYVKDIDHNGNTDHILAYQKNNHWYPAATKDELSKQLPLIRKKFTDYKTFAGKTLDEIFDRGELENARVLTVNTFSSVYLENSGNGGFTQHLLPEEAQTSKIFSFYSEDLNDDGYEDILLGGNFYGGNMYQGRYDAGYGLMLKNIRDRDFQAVGPQASGFFLRGEIRDIISLFTSTGKIIVVARNNLPLKIFKPTKFSLVEKRNVKL